MKWTLLLLNKPIIELLFKLMVYIYYLLYLVSPFIKLLKSNILITIEKRLTNKWL